MYAYMGLGLSSLNTVNYLEVKDFMRLGLSSPNTANYLRSKISLESQGP